MIRALVLDVGEIIVRLDFKRLFTALGLPATNIPQAMDLLSHWDAYDTFERGHLTSVAFFEILRKKFSLILPDAVLLPLWNSVLIGEIAGIDSLLTEVAAKVPVYGLTNASLPHLEYVKKLCPACRHFTQIFSSCELGLRKPEAAIYEAVLRAIHVPAAETLFIDDRQDNVTGARLAGMKAEQCLNPPDELKKHLEQYGIL